MKKCSLYPIDVITDEASLKGFYIEVVSYDCFTDYVVWNDCGNGIAIKYLTLREEQDIVEVAEIMRRNIKGQRVLKNIFPKENDCTAFPSIPARICQTLVQFSCF